METNEFGLEGRGREKTRDVYEANESDSVSFQR